MLGYKWMQHMRFIVIADIIQLVLGRDFAYEGFPDHFKVCRNFENTYSRSLQKNIHKSIKYANWKRDSNFTSEYGQCIVPNEATIVKRHFDKTSQIDQMNEEKQSCFPDLYKLKIPSQRSSFCNILSQHDERCRISDTIFEKEIFVMASDAYFYIDDSGNAEILPAHKKAIQEIRMRNSRIAHMRIQKIQIQNFESHYYTIQSPAAERFLCMRKTGQVYTVHTDQFRYPNCIWQTYNIGETEIITSPNCCAGHASNHFDIDKRKFLNDIQNRNINEKATQNFRSRRRKRHISREFRKFIKKESKSFTKANIRTDLCMLAIKSKTRSESQSFAGYSRRTRNSRKIHNRAKLRLNNGRRARLDDRTSKWNIQ